MEAEPGLLAASKRLPTPAAPMSHAPTEAGELLHKQAQVEETQLAVSPPSKFRADFLPATFAVGITPPPVGTEPALKDVSASIPTAARLSGLTLTAKAQIQVIQL